MNSNTMESSRQPAGIVPATLEQARRFWQERLAQALPLLSFPTDLPRPALLPEQVAAVPLVLPPGLAGRLHDLCARLACAPADLWLAVYQVFLYRYSGQADTVSGTVLCDTPLPLRQTLAPDLAFRALVAANQGLRAQLLPWAGHALADLFGARDGGAPASHAPVFQHRLLVQQGGQATPAPFGRLDTALTVAWDAQGGADACLQYNTSLFEAKSARRWALNLATLLGAVCDDPDATVGKLPLLHPSELAFIAASLDRTAPPFAPRFPSVHAGFERQAARTPDAEAVRCGAQALSYRQLDARADAIAEHLYRQGVRAGDLVGICTARTTDMIAAVIGVLKTGATYVPMDTKYPAARLDQIAAEARLRFVLVDARGRGLLTPGMAQEVALEDVGPAERSFAPPAIDAASLCHVIFTSGSTGKPKGVMAGHHNVLAFLEWIYATYSEQELAVVLCCSSLCFDLTVFEIWGPLTVGGRVVVVDNAAALVQQEVAGLTLVNTVPTALRLLVDEQALPASVMAVNVCGEPLDGQLVADLFARYPGVCFYNTYGPTEDTAYSTFYKMTGPVEGDPPIGIPIVHELGQVIDAQGMLAPVGAVGELLIAGTGVAQGYLYNPEGTAARFVQARDYAGRPVRAYHSGDFVRLRNDGQIQFVGRRDDQVKLRGFRIDLGDVVSALAHLPGVTDARVLVRRHKTGDVLVAYVSHQDMPPEAQGEAEGEAQGMAQIEAQIKALVEAQTRARLPSFMVPSFFVLFHKLPLNDNGKVDRHALAALDFDPEGTGGEAPDEGSWSDDERALAAIWKNILAVDRIGRDDDFFACGGNSLLAVRMIARLNRAFGVKLQAQHVFEQRTLAALAVRARREAAAELVPIERVDASAGVAPTYPQMAMLMDAARIGFNLGSVLRIDGPLDQQALRRSLRGLLARHDALRARYLMSAEGPRMFVDEAVPDILRVMAPAADGPAALDALVLEAVQAEWCAPFDLQAGPPVRALLVCQDPQRHVLVLSVHHVATDEWSTNILKHDLARLYAAETGAGAAPAALPWRYVDYAAWQARLHGTEEFGRQLAYWGGEFAALEAGLAYPASANAGTDSMPMRSLRLQPPAGMQALLARLGAGHGYTPYVVLMAALQLALAAYSGLEQQLVWSPVSRRTEPELEDSVGMYTNLVAIAARAGRALTAGAFLAEVDRKVAQARSHCDVSALTAVMGDPGLMPRLPMIGLNYIELPNETAWSLAGAKLTPVPLALEQEADLCALELTVRPGGQDAGITVAYDTAVFGGADVRRIVDAMWEMVELFGAHPERPLAAILPAAVAAAGEGAPA